MDDDLMDLTGDFTYDFFNPKAGLSVRLNDYNRFFASVAVGQREPLRADLKDGIKGGAVNPIQPERMIDYELGYHYEGASGTRLSANFYYMDYHNQMVQTGKLTDIGYKLMENVKNSYRTGIELEAAVPLWENKVRLDANATFSRNKINHCLLYDSPNTYGWGGRVGRIRHHQHLLLPDVVSAMGSLSAHHRALCEFIREVRDKQYGQNRTTPSRSMPTS